MRFVPKKQPYDQFCPIARALDLVGDRWTLLIVRDLLLGSARYGALLAALAPISTDVLARRLRELEASGIIDHHDDGLYGLTADGRRLVPVLRELGRWGATHLGAPLDTDLSASRALQILAVTGAGRTDAAPVAVEVWAGDLVWALTDGPDGLTIQRGPGTDVDASISIDGPTLWAVGRGQLDWPDALASGVVQVDGDAEIARRFLAGRLPVIFDDQPAEPSRR